MREALYLDDSYLKEFDAKVEKVMEVEGKKLILLNQTLFYPSSGGQPNDTGKLIRKSDGKEFKVIFVSKSDGRIAHQVEQENELKEGDVIHGEIDWTRRYKLMRSHTSAHIVSGLVHGELGAKITGNQIELDKVRIDYQLEEFDKDVLQKYIEKANEIIQRDLKITSEYITREEAEKDPSLSKLAMGLPLGLKEIRVVSIGDFDRQADGGTHVRSTKEIGRVEFIKCDNKGKNNRRVYYKLVD